MGFEADRCTAFDPHAKSVRHLSCVRQAEREERPATEEPAVLKGVHVGHMMDAGFEKRMVNTFHVTYYVAKKERPFSDFTDLVELQDRTGSTLPAFYRSDKAAAR